MTCMQYADDLKANSGEMAEVYYEVTSNDIFIEEVDFSLCHSLRKNWARHPHADVIDMVSSVQFLPAIQKLFVKPALSGNHAAESKPLALCIWNKSSASVAKPESSSSPTSKTRHKSSYGRSKLRSVMAVNTVCLGSLGRTNFLHLRKLATDVK